MIYIEGACGLLYAFNGSGALLWSKQLSTYQSGAPVVVNGVIYVSSGHHRLRSQYERHHFVEHGDRQWNPGGFARRRERAGLRYVIDDKVYALNASTGAQIWSYTTAAAS